MKNFKTLSSIIDYRIEAEYFEKRFLEIEKVLQSRDCVSFFDVAGYDNGRAYSSGYFSDLPILGGVKLCKIGDVTQKRSNENWVWLSALEFERQRGDFLNDDDILMTLTGDPPDVGKVSLFSNQELPSTWNQRVARVFLNDTQKIFKNQAIFFLILSTKYCRNQLERLAKGIRQRNLGIECIEKLQLPVVSLEFQHEILTCFEEVINLEKEAKKMFESADKLIEHGLKLDEIQLNSQSVNIKSLNESFKTTHRLDAEYFQPKFDELEQLLSDTGKAQRLGDFLVTNKRGTQPDYTEEGNGLRVLNSKHIRTNAIDTSDTRFANFSENQLIIKKFDVLINGTGVGTIGRCAVYLRDDLALPDNHVTVLRFDGIDPVFLSVQLNTIIGQLQVEKYFKGSSGQIELYPSDISNFLIWNAPKKIQDIVREQIINAEALSSKSKSLRSLIINVCELAIERTEELAIHELKKRYVNASYN